MTTYRSAIGGGYPYPIYVNEQTLTTREAIGTGGVYINETLYVPVPPPPPPTTNGFLLLLGVGN